jgi:trimeric autotransporter adhesin
VKSKTMKGNEIMRNRNTMYTAVLLACFVLLAWRAFAVVPSPDGGYPGGNTAEGQNALFSLTTGTYNTAVGWRSLWSNTEGSYNTAVGAAALLFNIGDPSMFEGEQNTAVGTAALLSNTTGFANSATGAFTLFSNTAGNHNTAHGRSALFSNTEGHGNTANGSDALTDNTTGNENTAMGTGALSHNTTGSFNTATGSLALVYNRTGWDNTAMGADALYSNTTGANNTAIGRSALLEDTTGGSNTACGHFALADNTIGEGNVALGNGALQGNTTGVGNIAVGYLAGYNLTTGSNNIDIGNQGVAGESDTIRIGATQATAYMAGVYGGMVANDGAAVLISPNGKLGTIIGSSRRFKRDIKPMDTASEAILALKPVSFRYKDDNTNTPQFGLIAEQVADVIPELVVRDKEGKPYSVRYDQVNAMLLNEFLKEHRKNKEQEAIIAQQRKDFEAIVTNLKATDTQHHWQIEALTAELQRVSAQLELTRPAPQTALNNP